MDNKVKGHLVTIYILRIFHREIEGTKGGVTLDYLLVIISNSP